MALTSKTTEGTPLLEERDAAPPSRAFKVVGVVALVLAAGVAAVATLSPKAGAMELRTQHIFINRGADPTIPPKLGRCYGDCDHNSDCEGDLVCYPRTGGSEVPDCFDENGQQPKDYDYCINTEVVDKLQCLKDIMRVPPDDSSGDDACGTCCSDCDVVEYEGDDLDLTDRSKCVCIDIKTTALAYNSFKTEKHFYLTKYDDCMLIRQPILADITWVYADCNPATGAKCHDGGGDDVVVAQGQYHYPTSLPGQGQLVIGGQQGDDKIYVIGDATNIYGDVGNDYLEIGGKVKGAFGDCCCGGNDDTCGQGADGDDTIKLGGDFETLMAGGGTDKCVDGNDRPIPDSDKYQCDN